MRGRSYIDGFCCSRPVARTSTEAPSAAPPTPAGKGRSRNILRFPVVQPRRIMAAIWEEITMTLAEARAIDRGASLPVGTVPRNYNFAADILQSNLAAGRADKTAYID